MKIMTYASAILAMVTVVVAMNHQLDAVLDEVSSSPTEVSMPAPEVTPACAGGTECLDTVPVS